MRRIAIILSTSVTLFTFSREALADDAEYFDTTDQGVSIQLDNDLFSGLRTDRDYTGGVGVAFETPRHNFFTSPVDSLRRHIDGWLPASVSDDAHALSSTQVGLIAMTPRGLSAREVQPGERPYANLLYLATSQLKIGDDGRHASYSSFAVGALGLPIMSGIQNAIHAVAGGSKPEGWDHQISNGGEPTFRFVRAEQWLLGSSEAAIGDGREAKLTLAASAGYLTEASVALSLRAGRIRSPWWNFNPELTDYMAAPIAPTTIAPNEGSESYGFFGARLKVIAYNSLLQGQFRSTDVRISGSNIEHIQGEAWAGFASNWGEWRVSYVLRYATREIAAGPAARNLVWGGINIERAF